MSKLVYVMVPIGILAFGLVLHRKANVELPRAAAAADLSQLSTHLRTIPTEDYVTLEFAGDTVPIDREHVRRKLDELLEQNMRYPGTVRELLRRAGRYEREFRTILRSNGVPEDFFYLAVAESHLSNDISPVGAVGFWQFMPATARQFGLRVDATIDERYHPLRSADAAARYLKQSYRQLGSWDLVAASYNMGVGGVHKAINRQKVNDYYDLKLNRETSWYLYRILAYKTLMQHPERYGIETPRPYRRAAFRQVVVSESIPDLEAFAVRHGTSLFALRTANPWLISSRLEVADTDSFEVLIPIERHTVLREMLRPGQADTPPNVELSVEG